MKRTFILFFILISLKILLAYNMFSPISRDFIIKEVEPQKIYNLEFPIINNSEKVLSDTLLLKRNSDYLIDYQKGTIAFERALKNVTIEYMILPKKIATEFYLYEPQTISDSLLVNIKRHGKRKLGLSSSKLNISGSKSISFSVANNSDLTFDQTLFLKINGQLSNNLNIESQLSDNQTPITPEGNSKELSTIDQIYIKLYGKQYEIKFGDLEMKFDDTQFINYDAKFEGIKAKWFNKNYYKGAIALSKGKKDNITFYCEEAKQGPYYLSTQENSGIKVVPGSETIYLNGTKLERGTDYTIDYSEGSITFTNKHFISSTSFVSATFLYSDEYYRQNLYLNGNKVNITDNLSIFGRLIWEYDDKKNPLQREFTEDDIQALEQAGDSIAWGNGVTETSTGEGKYKLSDDGNYYIYAPDDSLSIYNISFTFVGSNNGDYILSDNGEYYVYAGDIQGDYAPLIKLASPKNNLNYDVKLNWELQNFTFETESIITNHDKNSFSKIDDSDNLSGAFFAQGSLKPNWDKLKPYLKISYKLKKKNLYTFSTLQENSDSFLILPDSLQSSEIGTSLTLNPFNFFNIQTDYMQKLLKNYANITDYRIRTYKNETKIFPKMDLNIRKQTQSYNNNTIKKKLYDNKDVNISKNIKNIGLGTSYKIQTYKTEFTTVNLGMRNKKLENFVSLKKNEKLSVKLFYHLASTDSLQNNSYIGVDKQHTFGVESLIKTTSQYADIKVRHRIIENEHNYDLAEINLRNSFLKNALSINTNYQINNLEFYPKIRELIPVAYGLYDSTGTLGGEGGYDWIIKSIDYDHPQKSLEVKSSISLTFNPLYYFKNFPLKIETETYTMLYENSTSDEKMKVYLFDKSLFFNDETSVLSKKMLRQSLWWNIYKNKLKARFQYEINNVLDQRYQDSAENDFKQWENELTYKFSKPLSLKLYYDKENKTESIYQSKFQSDKTEFSSNYRANSSLILNTAVGVILENANSILSSDKYKIKNYYIQEYVTAFFSKNYRIFAKFNLAKIDKDSSFLDNINDKKKGYSLKTNFNFNYKLNKFTSATLKYNGTIYSSAKDEHKIELEVKAEF